MKKQLFILLTFCLTLAAARAGNATYVHENVRETPYPQQGHTLYINPAPLLVPQGAGKRHMVLARAFGEQRRQRTPLE